MNRQKSEKHHWWPECVSAHWAGADGGVTRYLSDGTELRLRPKNCGVIGNGHFIKLGRHPGETTYWDQNFESEFQNADSNFPALISYLTSLNFEERFGLPQRERFVNNDIQDSDFERLTEALVSLAIRSPMNRAAAVGLAERFRGPLPERERNSLITINLRDMQKQVFGTLRGRGKFAVIKSNSRELIFGDGFYHNLTSSAAPPMSARIMAHITPSIGVLYAVPMTYNSEPRISTLVVKEDEADALNEVIQIYSKEAIFYRSHKPKIRTDFASKSHQQFTSFRNIIEDIVHSMPGVPPYDESLDWLSMR